MKCTGPGKHIGLTWSISIWGEHAQLRQKAAKLCSVPAVLNGIRIVLHKREPCTRVAWYSCLQTSPSWSLQGR